MQVKSCNQGAEIKQMMLHIVVYMLICSYGSE